jgi:hypothetical protein
VNDNLQQGADLGTLTIFLTSLAIGLLIGLEREKSLLPRRGCAPFRWLRWRARSPPCSPSIPVRPGYWASACWCWAA